MIQLTQIHNESKLNFFIRPENWVHAKLDFKSLGIKFTLNTVICMYIHAVLPVNSFAAGTRGGSCLGLAGN